LSAGNDPYPWLNLWDWHSTSDDPFRGANRWHTCPGLMLAKDGSMKVRFSWGGESNKINKTSPYSDIGLPVGRWFDMEMHYVWSEEPTTIRLWINGQLALEQSGVITKAATHANVETYLKVYGSTQGKTPWTPTPTIRYVRDVRVAGERIWR
jgi:hypothetical protein